MCTRNIARNSPAGRILGGSCSDQNNVLILAARLPFFMLESSSCGSAAAWQGCRFDSSSASANCAAASTSSCSSAVARAATTSARACFLATLFALGPAQDPGAVGGVRMVPSQVVLAGGVAAVSPIGIEDARRRHQEDAEQDATRARTNEAHESCSSMGVKVPPPISAVNDQWT